MFSCCWCSAAFSFLRSPVFLISVKIQDIITSHENFNMLVDAIDNIILTSSIHPASSPSFCAVICRVFSLDVQCKSSKSCSVCVCLVSML